MDKKEVVEQIEQIKETLIDSKKFVPYEPNAMIMWGVISSILFLFTQNVIQSFGVLSGLLFLSIFISIGVIIEYILTKKINKKYDIETLTKKQKFIDSIYLSKFIFCILMTAVLIKANAINIIYPLWIFVIGFVSYIAGYIMNLSFFTKHGIISFILSLIVILAIYFVPNGLESEMLSYLFRIIAVITIGFGYIWMGLKLKNV